MPIRNGAAEKRVFDWTVHVRRHRVLHLNTKDESGISEALFTLVEAARDNAAMPKAIRDNGLTLALLLLFILSLAGQSLA